MREEYKQKQKCCIYIYYFKLYSFESGLRNTGKAVNHAYFYGFEYSRVDVLKILVVVTTGDSDDKVTKVDEV